MGNSNGLGMFIFYSNRWNKTVRNLLHSLVFNVPEKDLKKESEKKQAVGFFSTQQGRGLLSFIVSGAFHELIICSVCRKLTLENFCFFALNGVACMIEVKYFGSKKKKPITGIARVCRIMCQLSFMILTGRLFLAPFLRARFMQVLPLTQF